MAHTGSVFSQTLQSITATKLEELAKKRKTFEEGRQAVVEAVAGEQDAVQALVRLSAGVKTCFGIQVAGERLARGSTNNPRLEIDLITLDRILKQAQYDPSVSSKLLERWRETLLRHLEVQSLKFSFASLYGHLTNEWLQSKQPAVAPAKGEDTEMEDFEIVSGAKKLEGRRNWERAVFQAAKVKDRAITQLLKETFDCSSEDSKQLQQALKTLKEGIENHEYTLTLPGNFNSVTLDWTIKSLLTSELLSDEKRNVLKDFLSNPVIITEIADVLNMRMSALDSWSWGDEVLVEQRRQLNGTFAIQMHEDLLQAIFLQYIGIKWSVFWKKAFASFRRANGVWKSPNESIPAIDRKRRDYYLGHLSSRPNVQSKKQKIYRQTYFLSQLMDWDSQQISAEQGDEEADFDDAAVLPSRTKQTARTAIAVQAPRRHLATKAARRAAPASRYLKEPESTDESDADSDDDESSGDENANVPKNPMAAKQKLLHLLATDIQIKTRIHGEITCFRSQFDNLYPSLPHATIKHVLEFFGVSKRWLQFFDRFLQAPLRFVDDSSPPRTRKRGTPGSHVLSEVFGEVVLFCLDYKINQVAGGEIFWRLHDDFWFWSSNQEHCAKSWTTIVTFAETLGLSLNKGRTGCERMIKPEKSGEKDMIVKEVQKPLPQGQIRWGMLFLNPAKGRFEIDQDMVSKHIGELGRQLKNQSSSVFSWIRTWNVYATTFFTTNFGKAANCFGREHVDSMLSIHQRIQREIFDFMDETGEKSDSVVGYLRKTLHTRFGVDDAPDGYFFLPVELGGLEVQSPFIGLLQIRNMVAEKPSKLMDDFEEAEYDTYRTAKLKYENTRAKEDESPLYQSHDFKPKDPSVFMPFEEYIKYREELNYGFPNELSDIFDQLLQQPSEESIATDNNGLVKIALNALSGQQGLRGVLSNFYNMEPYWKWVVQLYGPEIIERFGGFNIVDPGLLPMGMVSLFRSGRVKWQE